MYPETDSGIIDITLPYVDGILEIAGHLSVTARIANSLRDAMFVGKTVREWLSNGTVTVSAGLGKLLANNRTCRRLVSFILSMEPDMTHLDRIVPGLDDRTSVELRMLVTDARRRISRSADLMVCLNDKSFRRLCAIIFSQTDDSPRLRGRSFSSVEGFYGRSEEIRSICLTVRENPVTYITGMAGIGKTELCRKFAEEHRGADDTDIVWVDYAYSLRDSLKRDLRIVGTYDEVPNDGCCDGFEIILDILSRTVPLLVVDNYIPGNDGEDLRRLADTGCKILLITRETPAGNCPHVEIGPMGLSDAEELLGNIVDPFNRDYLADHMELVKEVLEMVECHTLTVVIIGGLVKVDRIETLKTVKDVLRASLGSTRMYENYDLRLCNVRERLMELFDITTLPDDSVEVLRRLSTLPMNGIPLRHLEAIVDFGESLDILKTSRWVMMGYDKNRHQRLVSMHPLALEALRLRLRPSVDNISDLLEAIDRVFEEPAEASDLDRKTCIAGMLPPVSEVLCGYGFSTGDDGSLLRTARVLKRFGGHCYNLSMLRESEKMFTLALEIDPFLQNKDPVLFVSILHNLAHTQTFLGEYDDASKNFRDVLEIAEGNDLIDNRMRCRIHINMGILYNEMGRSEDRRLNNNKALNEYFRAIECYDSEPPEDSDLLCTIYNNIGNAYSDLGNIGASSEYSIKALTEVMKVPEDRRNWSMMCTVLSNLTESYIALGNHKKAMETAEYAYLIALERCTVWQKERAQAFRAMGDVHSYGEDEEFNAIVALGFYESAKIILERIDALDRNQVRSLSEKMDRCMELELRRLLADGNESSALYPNISFEEWNTSSVLPNDVNLGVYRRKPEPMCSNSLGNALKTSCFQSIGMAGE